MEEMPGVTILSEIAPDRPRPTDDRPVSGVPTGCLEPAIRTPVI